MTPTALAASVTGLGLETLARVPLGDGGRPQGAAGVSAPDPYKALQVDPEAEDEVIVAAYRRLARKYHPDTATGPEAAPGWRRSTRRGRSSATRPVARPTTVSGPLAAAMSRRGDSRPRRRRHRRRSRTTGCRRGWGCCGCSGHAEPRMAPPRHAGARDRVTRLVEWPLVGRRRLRPVDAYGRRHRGRRTATGPPFGQCPDLRPVRGWSLGEIVASDLEYLEWLDRMPIGRPYRDEIDAILRQADGVARRAAETRDRRGLFRRR